MDEHPAGARQPRTGFDRHPANCPGLIVEQKVLDDADLAVARLDRATHQTTRGEQHGPSLRTPAPSAARLGVSAQSALLRAPPPADLGAPCGRQAAPCAL